MIVRIPVQRRYGRRAARITSWCLLAVGIAGLGVYVWSLADAGYYQASQEELFVSSPVAMETPVGVLPAKPVRLIKAERPDPQLLGRLVIPRLGISVLVREGIDSRTLRRAIGHVPGTALPGEAGNAVLAGHRDTFLRDLRQVERGDEIRFVTATAVHRYTVREMEIVGPEAIEEMAATEKPSLTLVTCFPFRYVGPATRRLIVRAHLE